MSSGLKTLIFILLSVAVLFTWWGSASAADKAPVAVNLFYGKGCPHCAKAIPFLENLAAEDDSLEVRYFEIYSNESNAKLFQLAGQKIGIDTSGVPLTVVGDESIVGFGSEKTSGKKVEDAIAQCRRNGCEDKIAELIGEDPINTPASGDGGGAPDEDEEKIAEEVPEQIDLPFVGTVDTEDFSIPTLTVIIAAVDGFNPCAMWVLIFLITLLLALKDRRKMWILGVVFLVTSAAVYFVFMAAWLNLFLFIGALFWVRLIVAAIALVGGIYSIRSFYKNKDGGCKVTNTEQRQRLTDRFRNVVNRRSLLWATIGIMGLAFLVNLIELLCSAGLPAVYTNILSLSDLPTSQYYLYLLLYCLIFLADDIIIFAIAMLTLKVTGVSTKYGRWASLIGGIIMIVIAIMLIFFPQFLMFG